MVGGWLWWSFGLLPALGFCSPSHGLGQSLDQVWLTKQMIAGGVWFCFALPLLHSLFWEFCYLPTWSTCHVCDRRREWGHFKASEAPYLIDGNLAEREVISTRMLSWHLPIMAVSTTNVLSEAKHRPACVVFSTFPKCERWAKEALHNPDLNAPVKIRIKDIFTIDFVCKSANNLVHILGSKECWFI